MYAVEKYGLSKATRFDRFTVSMTHPDGVIALVQGAAAVFTFLLSPIGLTVLAILGLIAALVYLWNTNEEFRNAVINTWNTIRDTMEPIIRDIWALIQENWGPIKEFVSGIWSDIQSILTDAMVIIQQIVRGGAAVITYIWDNFGDQIIQYIRGAFQIISGVIRGWFQFARGIFQTIKSVLTGDWRGAWEGIKQIFRGIMTAITGIARGFWTGLKALWSAAFTIVKNTTSRVWGDIKDSFSTSVTWIRDKINDLVGFFEKMPGKIKNAVSGAFDSIGTQFGDAINGVINWWNGLSFSIPGIDPPGPGPKFGGFTVSTPNLPTFADGAFVTGPTLAWVGEGQDNEFVAPEPMLTKIIRDNSGGNIDYGRLASAIAAALAPILARFGGITQEELERIIASAAPKIDIDARSDHEAAGRLASAIGFELRLLGYGGKSNV